MRHERTLRRISKIRVVIAFNWPVETPAPMYFRVTRGATAIPTSTKAYAVSVSGLIGALGIVRRRIKKARRTFAPICLSRSAAA
jgi:hypothetical protein